MPYGINFIVDTDDSNSLNEALQTGYKTLPLNKAFLERSNNTFKFLVKTPEETKVFTLGDFLGGGSYGKTYTINEQIDNRDVVVKIIDYTFRGYTEDAIETMEKIYVDNDTRVFVEVDNKLILKDKLIQGAKKMEQNMMISSIQEFIIQCMCIHATENEEFDGYTGPFVPRLYLFAVSYGHIFIISEKMDTTLHNHILSNFLGATIVRDCIQQISKILDILQKNIQYSHRDFKADNVMIKFENDRPCIKLIDFGYSCIQYDNFKLSSDPSKMFEKCDIKSRDLSSLFYQFVNMYYKAYNTLKAISCPMRHIMEVLSFTNGYPKNWSSQYKYYNKHEENPNLIPDVVYTIFKNLEITADYRCSPINPSWIHSVKIVNHNVMSLLTDKEIKELENRVVKNSMSLLPKSNKNRMRKIKANSLFMTRKTGKRNLLKNLPTKKNRSKEFLVF